MMISPIAKIVDLTNLSSATSHQDIENFCIRAYENRVACVCIQPRFIPLAKDVLKRTNTKIAVTADFPHASHCTDDRAHEVIKLLQRGAHEIDIVMQYGLLIEGQHRKVENDLRVIAVICHAEDAIIKVIIETAALTPEQVITATKIVAEAGCDYVKTSTGFHKSGGATLAGVKRIRETLDAYKGVGIKAAGGIRTYEKAQSMIVAMTGAESFEKAMQQVKQGTAKVRIGASSPGILLPT